MKSTKSSTRNERERGSVLLLYTIMAAVLVLIVGLAVDVTMLYIAQGQLQTAVDGAASGAVRLLNSTANETEISGEFVKANMPNKYWLTSGLKVTGASITNSANLTTSSANVSATVVVPTLFMRWLSINSNTVAAAGTATVWNIQPCTLTYPTGTAPALSSVVFSEAIDLQGWGPAFILPHGKIIAFYNDEHSMILGINKVYVTNAAGSTTSTDYSSSFTAFNGNLGAGSGSTVPLPVGTTALSGDQAGTDTATWNSTYNYQNSRPMWPALFITDITTNPNDTSGDWQQGGTAAIPPNAVFGTWKGATRCVNYSSTQLACPPGGSQKGGAASGGHPAVTLAEDADSPANCSGSGSSFKCNGVPDTPIGGWTQSQQWGTELVWYIDSLGLRPGRAYRLQLMLHDGDQNKSGGDAGQGCMVAKY